MAEARALQAVQLAQTQAEARLRWQRRAEQSLLRRPTSASRRERAHRRFMAEIERPCSPSTPRQRAVILPYPRPLHDGEGVLRQTRHDVSNLIESGLLYIKIKAKVFTQLNLGLKKNSILGLGERDCRT